MNVAAAMVAFWLDGISFILCLSVFIYDVYFRHPAPLITFAAFMAAAVAALYWFEDSYFLIKHWKLEEAGIRKPQ